MVKFQRKNMYNMYKRSNEHNTMVDDDEESCLVSLGLIHGNSGFSYKNIKPKLLYIIFLSFVSCSLVLGLQLLSSDSLLNSFGFIYKGVSDYDMCSSVANGTICCERNSIRSDVCVMRGNIRTHSSSSSILLYNSKDSIDQSSDLSDGENEKDNVIQHEKIRPYTRKWESNVMATIGELNLISRRDTGVNQKCDVYHDVPAVFFSTGGYTGNLYHEFNDGILPLYITSQRFNKKVVFVILDYHNWWITKYGDILSQLSDFQPIDFSADKRIHCFPEAIVGLRIHDELSIDASLMVNNKTIVDFHDLLDRAYWPRISGLIEDEEREIMEHLALSPSFNPITMKKVEKRHNKPKLVIVSRNGSRAITNEDLMVKMAEGIGFEVEVLKPERNTELAKIYRVLNSSDVMIGVHGAAMTHFLFTKPGSVFIQVVPLGTDWASETYYGEPSRRLGLKYVGYNILPKESSLYDDYDKRDPILIDPDSVNAKGWEFTKKIYLDRQTVSLDLRRFRKHLLRAYYYTVAKKTGRLLAG